MLPAFVVVFVAGQLLGGHLGIVSAVVDRGETFESFMSIGDFLNLAEPSLLEDDVVVAEGDVFAVGVLDANVEEAVEPKLLVGYQHLYVWIGVLIGILLVALDEKYLEASRWPNL